MSSNGNGKGEITPKMLSLDEKVDMIIEGMSEMAEMLNGRFDELEEKIDNVSTPGGSFGEEEIE